MKIKSEKQARTIIAKCADWHVANSIKSDEIKLLIGCTTQVLYGRTYIQGSYYTEITKVGFVDKYGRTWTWGEMFEDSEDGEIFDRYADC